MEALDCPRCGVIYAKAEARALAAVVDAPSWSGEADDEALEVRVRILAIPIALAGATLLVWTGPGQFLVRTFASMWVHEIGHAIAAWLCGYPALPGPWFTPVADARSPIVAVLFAGALAYAVFRFWNTERRALAAASAGLLALQLGCTLLASTAARQVIVFSGDGGCLVFGTLLMATMYAPAESALRRGWLRWSFLVIGALSFADAFAQWWGARSDYERIPFGHNEGKGLSDPSVLTELFGWTTGALVRRYVVLGCVCLASLAGAYVWGLWRSSERGPRQG
ncbi:MAG: hypothetical protein ACJ78Y_08030 [Myxococcales bacterium]